MIDFAPELRWHTTKKCWRATQVTRQRTEVLSRMLPSLIEGEVKEMVNQTKYVPEECSETLNEAFRSLKQNLNGGMLK